MELGITIDSMRHKLLIANFKAYCLQDPQYSAGYLLPWKKKAEG